MNRYLIGAFVGAAIGLALSYLYSQSDPTALTSNLWVGALIGALVGLYLVSAASLRGKDGCGAESSG